MIDPQQLIQIVDAAVAEAVRKGGAWIECRPGCYQCCRGAFEISALDAQRLRSGLRELEARDPARASRVRERARHAAARLRRDFPVDAPAAVLSQAADDDEPCPALDPATGTCDLYESRPLLCRTFGPAIAAHGAVGACELCFPGAGAEEIAACAVPLDCDALEVPLLQQLPGESASPTLVALVLES